MKQLIIIIVLAGAGYLAYLKFHTPPPPTAEPPAPPPVMEEVQRQLLTKEQMDRIKLASNDTDPQIRWEAVQLLISSRDPRGEEILIRMLQRDGDAGIRRNVVGVLSERGPEMTEYLVAALRDSDADVRLRVLEALQRKGDPATVGPISECLRDSEERVRLAALKTLNNLQERRNREIDEQMRKHEESVKRYEEALRKHQEAQQALQKGKGAASPPGGE